jgi:pilus assembly protein CpaB
MKITRVAVLGVAVVAGVVAAVLAFNIANRPPAPEVVAVPATTTDVKQVLVASADIPMGTRLTDASFHWQDWPKTGISDKFIVKDPNVDSTSKVVGAIARAAFYTGEPIIDGKLITSNRGFLSAILPTGERAVATRIAADTSAGGFILPNDRVDVILSRRDREAEKQAGVDVHTSETILQNVRVLAIDQTVEEKNGQRVVVGKTATLELAPSQAETLALSRQLGTLTLALRSLVDAKGEASTDDDGRSTSRRVNVIRFGVSTTSTSR